MRLPSELILDSGEKTNLADEYLTLANDILRIKKVYDCSKSKVSSTVYIVANHPNAVDAENLLSLKEKDLQKIIKGERNRYSIEGQSADEKSNLGFYC